MLRIFCYTSIKVLFLVQNALNSIYLSTLKHMKLVRTNEYQLATCESERSTDHKTTKFLPDLPVICRNFLHILLQLKLTSMFQVAENLPCRTRMMKKLTHINQIAIHTSAHGIDIKYFLPYDLCSYSPFTLPSTLRNMT